MGGGGSCTCPRYALVLSVEKLMNSPLAMWHFLSGTSSAMSPCPRRPTAFRPICGELHRGQCCTTQQSRGSGGVFLGRRGRAAEVWFRRQLCGGSARAWQDADEEGVRSDSPLAPNAPQSLSAPPTPPPASEIGLREKVLRSGRARCTGLKMSMKTQHVFKRFFSTEQNWKKETGWGGGDKKRVNYWRKK